MIEYVRSMLILLFVFYIKNNRKIMERSSTLGKVAKFSRTASTMQDTRPSLLFRKPRMERRLNSTIRYDTNISSKFSKLNLTRENSVNWKKWKKNGFVLACTTFNKVLHRRIEKQIDDDREMLRVSDSELKLRHKIREMMKLREDIEKTKENNALIKLIEDYHETKINGFFQQLEKYLHKEP